MRETHHRWGRAFQAAAGTYVNNARVQTRPVARRTGFREAVGTNPAMSGICPKRLQGLTLGWVWTPRTFETHSTEKCLWEGDGRPVT